MGDKTRGLFKKFNVTRTDGQSAPGHKHFGCDYFVLDLTHDEFATDALKTYARKCRRKYPLLAADLDKQIAARGHFFTAPDPGERR